MVGLFFAAAATALATGLGVLPVYWLGERARALTAAMWGIVIGVMGVAAIQGLLLPGLRESSAGSVILGLAVGVVFLGLARRLIGEHEAQLGAARGADARRGILVVLVLFVHSLPEGLALGAAWASHTADLGLFVFLAIGIQNIPEGTATAIPLREAGISLPRAFWTATLTSAPQPVGALLAYALAASTRGLLGASFGFAAGAMLALLAVEVIPDVAGAPRRRLALAAVVVSAAAMAALGAALQVG